MKTLRNSSLSFLHFLKNSSSALEIFGNLNYSINVKSCDIMMTINNKVEYIFEYIFRILYYSVMKLGQLIDITT